MCIRDRYLGIEYQWEIRLLLRADEVPAASLRGRGRLGYSAWLGLQPKAEPRGDLVFGGERARE